MALIITMRKGQDFYIGDEQVVLTHITSPLAFKLRFNGKPHVVKDGAWTSLSDIVRVSAGTPRRNMRNYVKVLIDADSVKVLRGDMYRKFQQVNTTKEEQ